MSAFAAAAVDIHSQTCLINANAAPIAQLPSPSLSVSLSDNCNESASDNINGHINKEEEKSEKRKKKLLLAAKNKHLQAT